MVHGGARHHVSSRGFNVVDASPSSLVTLCPVCPAKQRRVQKRRWGLRNPDRHDGFTPHFVGPFRQVLSSRAPQVSNADRGLGRASKFRSQTAKFPAGPVSVASTSGHVSQLRLEGLRHAREEQGRGRGAGCARSQVGLSRENTAITLLRSHLTSPSRVRDKSVVVGSITGPCKSTPDITRRGI